MAWTNLAYDKANNLFSGLPDSVYSSPNGLCYPLSHYYGARQIVRWTLPVAVQALRALITPAGGTSGTQLTVGCYQITDNADWNNATITYNNSSLTYESTLLGSTAWNVGSGAFYIDITITPWPSAGALALTFIGISNNGTNVHFAEGGITRLEYEEAASSFVPKIIIT